MLGHSFFPNYSVRIKKLDFCDGTTSAYTGYIDIEARLIFFYFFKSRNDPATDDVISWTSSNPECTLPDGVTWTRTRSLQSPFRKRPTYQSESWNTNANIFFVDQPIGVGFSYVDYGEAVVYGMFG